MELYVPVHRRGKPDKGSSKASKAPVSSEDNLNTTSMEASKWAEPTLQSTTPPVKSKEDTDDSKPAPDNKTSQSAHKTVKFDVDSSKTTNDSSSSLPKKNEYVKAFKKYNKISAGNKPSANNKSSTDNKAPAGNAKKTPRKPGGWLTKEERKAMAAPQPKFDDMTTGFRLRYDDHEYDDGGWGEQPEYDLNAPNQLLDWEGNIAPAPVEWDGRRACQRDNWCDFIVKYINESQSWFAKQEDGEFLSNQIEDTSHELFTSENNGEVAPKDWIMHQIENQTLQSFWTSLLQLVPEPIDQEDLNTDPFWLRYELDSNMLAPYEHVFTRCKPVVKGKKRQPDDDSYWLWLRSKKQTAHISTEEYLMKHYPEDETTLLLHREEMDMLHGCVNKPWGPEEPWGSEEPDDLGEPEKPEEPEEPEEQEEPEIPLPEPYRPKEDIYLRPMVLHSDLQNVLDIYQHYAKETVYVTDLEAPTLEALKNRLAKVKHTSMPMVVAVQRQSKPKPSVTADGKPRDKILGFAFASETEGRHTQNSHVANIEVYVANEYQTKGIGKSLIDRMLYLVDPLYTCTTDVKWKPPKDKPEFTCPGGKRVLGAVRIVVYYGADERERLDWIKKWVESFGFAMEADFSQCGMKLGKWTRQAIFQRSTGSDLNPETVVRSSF